MKPSAVHCLFFSPAGTTKRVTTMIAEPLGLPPTLHDITPDREPQSVSLGPDGLLIAAIPVYSGRVPALAAQRLAAFKGAGTPAVAVAVYGNREYEDALLELQDILTENGFNVIAGAAFIAEHCIFPNVAKGRPDKSDEAVARDFGRGILKTLDAFVPGRNAGLTVKGNKPYREVGPGGMFPTADARCTHCGICVDACPNAAIQAATPDKTDPARCITCTACIKACPEGARGFHNEIYPVAAQKFEQANSARKEPELFFAG